MSSPTYRWPLLLAAIFFLHLCSAQVGIGTADPQSLLEVRSSSETSPSNTDGLLVPKIAEFPAIDPTSDQTGMIVFVTGTGTPDKGFYFWDNSIPEWVPFIFPTVKKIDDLEDGKSDSDGSNNGSSLFLGEDAGRDDNGNDNQNVGIGFNAMIANTSGNRNVGVGYLALNNNINGSDNIAVGHKSLEKNTDGINNTAIGRNALNDNTTGKNNTALGRNSLNANTVGQNNVAVGSFTMVNNTSGINNVAIGNNSLNDNTTGSANLAVGYRALIRNTNGQRYVAVGDASMLDNTSGVQNLAAGSQSLQFNTTGSDNVALGFGANNNSTTAANNVGIGTNALRSSITGGQNVAVGRSAGFEILGSGNVVLGFEAGQNSVGSGNVFLGNKAGREETGSNLLYIENNNGSLPLIGGNFTSDRVGINRTIASLTNTFEVGGTASKATAGDWLANSDKRLKKNIESIDGSTALEKIGKLRGVTYLWDDNKTGTVRPTNIQYGFIAQELMEVFPENVTMDNQGYYQTAYGSYDAMYVEAIKELTARLSEKDEKIQELENRLDKIETMLNKG